MKDHAAALLAGAWDVHLHAGPDVIPRAQRADEVLRDARAAGMAAIGLKDHCGSTAALAAVLQARDPDGPRVLGSVTLNPPVGGFNPCAVEAALREGARTVWFPTYASRRHLEVCGRGPFPLAEGHEGLDVWRDGPGGALKPEVLAVLEAVRAGDGVLATGHLDPRESLALFAAARDMGIRRMVLTHATLKVTDAPLEAQRRAVALGAVVEHCMLALTGEQPDCTPDRMVAEIRELGVEHVILTSDLGKPADGPVVAGFGDWLARLEAGGLPHAGLRRAVVDNPARLFS